MAKKKDPDKGKLEADDGGIESDDQMTFLAIEEHLAQGYDGREIRAKLMRGHDVTDPVRGTKACPRPCFIHRKLEFHDAVKMLERGLAQFRECSTVSKEQIVAMILDCYRNCLAQGNATGAAQIAMQLARLCGFTELQSPAVTNLIANIQNMPQDPRRTQSADYRIMDAARIALLPHAMSGKAGPAQAVIAATSMIAESFPENDGPRPEYEAELVGKVRSKLITLEHFPGGPIEPIERKDDKGNNVPAIDDFASLQTVGKKEA